MDGIHFYGVVILAELRPLRDCDNLVVGTDEGYPAILGRGLVLNKQIILANVYEQFVEELNKFLV